ELDRRARERPSHPLLVVAAYDEAAERGGFLLYGRVGVVGSGERPLRIKSGELRAQQIGFLLDVEAGEHERHLVTETAEGVHADLDRRWRRFTEYPCDADAVDAV